ncbi:MAG: aminoglycoside phosphotransferase family protein [Chthoniobacterales bacterium]|nr:aminoglycoside phosphotransferase family protein [Chthoniobacterales bacterium]
MNNPILKNHWERFKDYVILEKKAVATLVAPYSSEPLEAFVLLSQGCANTNYKVTFKNGKAPIVLRFYTREKSSILREGALHRWVREEKIPIPEIYHEDSSCTLIDHPYAIMEWVEGELMRDVILSGEETAIHECAFNAGKYLNFLRAITFPQGGFFQKNLVVRPFHESEKYKPYIFSLLQDSLVQKSLGNKLHQAISKWIELYSDLLPREREANLTHGDFDPANMLVKKINGQWKVASILDWEFSFVGTYFVDMGMFLRYAHKLPSCYEEGFVRGIEAGGKKLLSTWRLKTKLIDLLSLLRLLQSHPRESRPNLHSDVVSLIAHTVTLG